jgi:hypothetical protein
MTAFRLLSAGALMLALAGCAIFRAPEEEPPARPPEPEAPAEPEMPAEPEAPAPPVAIEPARRVVPLSDLERLLDYFRQVRKLAGADLGREHEAVRSAYARTRSDFDRMRLAMVLAQPDSGQNDEARALDLLEPLVRNRNSPLHGLALLVHTFVQEYRRLGRNMQGMQQKLDALKEMERSLIQRKR